MQKQTSSDTGSNKRFAPPSEEEIMEWIAKTGVATLFGTIAGGLLGGREGVESARKFIQESKPPLKRPQVR